MATSVCKCGHHQADHYAGDEWCDLCDCEAFSETELPQPVNPRCQNCGHLLSAHGGGPEHDLCSHRVVGQGGVLKHCACAKPTFDLATAIRTVSGNQ